MLIFTHAVPSQYWARTSCNKFPKIFSQREIGLELVKSGVLQLEDGATQLLKLIRLRLGEDLQQDVSEHHTRFFHRSARLYQQSDANTTLQRNQTCNERALQVVGPRGSSRMCCVDFFCWKTRHSQDQSKCVFSALLKKATRTVTLQTLRETWCNDERLRSHDSPPASATSRCHLAGAYTGQGKENE